MKVKRRVQAQRKFAQGALIPLYRHINSARNDVNLSLVKEGRNIVHNNLTAKSLLDLVSFQNMHTHNMPRVVLTRMPLELQNGQEAPIKPSVDNLPSEAQQTKVKAKVARNSTMCLRSQKLLKRASAGKRKLKAPQTSKPSKRKRATTLKKQCSTSDYDDDETPLKFLKTSLTSNAAIVSPEKEVEVRVTRKEEKVNETEKEVEVRVTRSSLHQGKVNEIEKPKTRQGKVNESEGRVTRSVKIPAKPINKSGEQNQAPARVSNTNGETFKEPTVPTRSFKVTNNNLADSAPKVVNDKASNTHNQFYGSQGIARWLDSHSGSSVEKANETDVSLRPNSPCPSEAIRTVKDVVTAPLSVLSKRCKNCCPCDRVDTIEQISNWMQRTGRAVNNDDVYEFNADRDDARDPPPGYVNRKRRDSRAQDPPSTADDESQVYYLDVMTESTHVVQMTLVKIPNVKERMMRARLIPRSEAHITQDVSLVEHEDLFNQLLQTLKVNTNEGNQAPKPSSKGTPVAEKPPSKVSGKTRAKNVTEESKGRGGKTPNEKKTAKGTNEEPVVAGVPQAVNSVSLVEAPVFQLTESEFNDPIAFFEKIAPAAEKFGICKVVAPSTFRPKCILKEDIKFNVTNHYLSRLFNRWGPAAREMSAMKAYLATQNVHFSRVPLLESLEVNLPKLYLVVQRNGGLKEVIEKKRWGRVAEEMRFSKSPSMEKTLDTYYVKNLLPYDTATNEERQHMMGKVERYWNRKHRKLVEWSLNPLHHKKKLLGESDSSEDEAEENADVAAALVESEDCVVIGRPMNLSGFKKVAKQAEAMYVPDAAATPEQIEEEYWRLVLFGTEHVCVNAASIDTGVTGIGFPQSRSDTCGRHPWNLKMLSENYGNELRYLDGVLGVTVPTLHLGMVYSTSCWHRDPHGLPWMEYMHEGPPKKWYGIPDEQSTNFRNAVESLCPTSCQNKPIWLSSDITMIPPNLLREHNVSLSHAVQNPGEYIIVFPKAYSCSIATGFTITESVYFATNSWLRTVPEVFRVLRESCEPTTFSLEQLLLAMAQDARCSPAALRLASSQLAALLKDELYQRHMLTTLLNVKTRVDPQGKKRKPGVRNVREQMECDVCRATLYLSKVTGVLNKKSSLCLEHAVKLLIKPREKADPELVIFYPENQLTEIMASVKRRLDASH